MEKTAEVRRHRHHRLKKLGNSRPHLPTHTHRLGAGIDAALTPRSHRITASPGHRAIAQPNYRFGTPLGSFTTHAAAVCSPRGHVAAAVASAASPCCGAARLVLAMWPWSSR